MANQRQRENRKALRRLQQAESSYVVHLPSVTEKPSERQVRQKKVRAQPRNPSASKPVAYAGQVWEGKTNVTERNKFACDRSGVKYAFGR